MDEAAATAQPEAPCAVYRVTLNNYFISPRRARTQECFPSFENPAIINFSQVN